MDIEELSKSQIILLVLLVSFVTSIATGIVTVSLMDQAPPAIAQTVNRVIERTVETVAPSAQGQSAATVVTQEKTVVVKESDLVSQAVAKISPSIVRIYRGDPATSAFLGLGIVLDKQGTVVTDTAALGDLADATVVLSNGTAVRAFVRGRNTDTDLALLQASSTADQAPVWIPATVSSAQPTLGQSVVALSGKTIARIVPGLVTAIPDETMMDTDIAGDGLYGGSPLINTDGDLIGVSTGVSRASSSSGFMSAALLIPPPAKKAQ
ncbi:MAG TPA: serine protease [Candidatus Paceibacterota bacterium]|nr:serine protease [Candidatus Paceibacterota bacterium]